MICHSNLNGHNYNDGNADYWTGILWYSNEWSTDSSKSLKKVTMAIKPNNV